MKVNVGFAAIMTAAATMTHFGRERPTLRTILVAAVVALTLATLAEDVTGRSFGIDDFLFPDQWRGGLPAGRMAPTTAVCFLTMAFALAPSRASRWTDVVTIVPLVIAGTALVGHLYDVSDLYRAAPFVGMAVNTALAVLLLTVAIAASRPERGLAALLVDLGVAGRTTRRLLPAALGAPILVGWLRLEGQRAGWYGTEFGLAIMVLGSSGLLIGLVWSNGIVLQRTARSERGESKFRALLESAPDAIVIVGADGRITIVNSQAEAIFGYPRAELLGQPVEILIPPKFHDAHPAHRTGFFEHPRPRPMAAGQALLGRRRNGEEFPVEVSLSPIETEEGRLITAAIRDVTDRRRIERAMAEKNVELENAIQAKDRFLTNISHELRTPLNAVIGFTGTLLMRLPGPLTTDQESQLRMVDSSGKHLLSLINDLLDLAKIQSGRLSLNLEPVACADVVVAVVSTLAPLAAAKGLHFPLQADRPAVTMRTDRRALTQILINLANNAIKFTETGDVQLRLEVANGQQRSVMFHVTDTGIGIRPDDLKRLFQAFEQVDAGRARRHEGTGLGLHLSQRLAELLGGTIRCVSEPGVGSTFTLALPLEA
jgi:protein-histidine pros-kinase